MSENGTFLFVLAPGLWYDIFRREVFSIIDLVSSELQNSFNWLATYFTVYIHVQ